MTLLELRVAGFGRLHDLTVEFSPQLSVVCGPNESGKSTLVECIIRLLFGYPGAQYKKARDDFKPWFKNAPYQATLAYRLDNQLELETQREFDDEVHTKTYERARRVDIHEYSGSRKASPGQEFLKLSLPAFEAAAVIRATEFAQDVEADGRAQLAERLASLVGAAGDAGAADAAARLKKFIAELGGAPHAPKTLITQARADKDEAERRLADHDARRARAAAAIERRTFLQSRIDDLEEAKRRLAADHAAARLRRIRECIAAGEAAESALEQARRRYRDRQLEPAAVAGRMQAAEDGVVAWRTARESESAMRQRVADAARQREEAQRALADSLRALGQANGKVRELEERSAGLPDRTGIPEIGEDDLRRLESLSDRADRLEAEASTKATIAGVSRQKDRPGAAAALGSAVVGALLLSVGLLGRMPGVVYGGIAFFVVGLILSIVWAAGGRRKTADVTDLERAAEAARAAHEQASAELWDSCRHFGCRDFADVREAYHAQQRARQLQAELAVARQAAEQCEAGRAFRAEQLGAFDRLDREVESSVSARTAAERHLAALFDELCIPDGEIADRIEAWRASGHPGERVAQAKTDVEHAEAQLARALGGSTLDALRAEELALAAQLASIDYDYENRRLETTTPAPAEDLELALNDARAKLAGAEAEIAALMGHLPGRAELEEALALASEEEARLTEIRTAAELAMKTIERLQDAVHRDFAPVLNEALSAAAAQVTAGRYEHAFVDPASLHVKVAVPETGQDVELERLSSGTREQLYLSLRAAVAQTLGSGERVPLILDDALAHSDDARLEAAIRHLCRLGAGGQQIILFSQRADVAAIAKRLGAPAIELPGP